MFGPEEAAGRTQSLAAFVDGNGFRKVLVERGQHLGHPCSDGGMVGGAGPVIAVCDVHAGAMGGGAHLQRMFPVQKVRYMYFTGEFIDASEAHRLGAVERVVPRDQLVETARSIAAKIAEKSPCLLYTSPSPRDAHESRMPSSA